MVVTRWDGLKPGDEWRFNSGRHSGQSTRYFLFPSLFILIPICHIVVLEMLACCHSDLAYLPEHLANLAGPAFHLPHFFPMVLPVQPQEGPPRCGVRLPSDDRGAGAARGRLCQGRRGHHLRALRGRSAVGGTMGDGVG